MNTPIVTLSDFLKAARRVAARQCLVKLLGGAQAHQYIIVARHQLHHCVRIHLLIIIVIFFIICVLLLLINIIVIWLSC